jgi:hypothetical protein
MTSPTGLFALIPAWWVVVVASIPLVIPTLLIPLVLLFFISPA